MLDVLRSSLHYTYTFFPDDSVKKEVPLKVWQKPTYNWKLECENTPEKTLVSAIEQLQVQVDSPWLEY